MLGTVNPVAAPHFNFTMPEPTGVVGVIAPEEPDVLGLVAEILPPLAAGNVVVGDRLRALAAAAAAPRRGARRRRRPGGRREPDLRACARSSSSRWPATATSTRSSTPTGDPEVARLAADSVTRVARAAGDDYLDVAGLDSLSRIEPFVELKTAWHPVGT